MSQFDLLRAPLMVSWQMTRNCDLACLHCCTDSAPGRHLKDELTAAQAMHLAADIVRNEVPYVMLCGGEPLTVPHFLAVAEYLGQSGVMLKIETNGQLLDEAMAERLARLPVRSVQVSLDGDTQAVYAAQRPGASLARAHAACAAVRRAGLPLEVTFAPTRLNLHEAEAVIARAEGFGAFRFNTGHLMRIGRAARLWGKIAADEAAYDAFRAMLARRAEAMDGTMQICHEPFTVEDGLRRNLDSPSATLLVLPQGQVKIVAPVGYTCGDMRYMTLAEAWESYKDAWDDTTVLAAVHRAIDSDACHADANSWTSVPNGVLEKCPI